MNWYGPHIKTFLTVVSLTPGQVPVSFKGSMETYSIKMSPCAKEPLFMTGEEGFKYVMQFAKSYYCTSAFESYEFESKDLAIKAQEKLSSLYGNEVGRDVLINMMGTFLVVTYA